MATGNFITKISLFECDTPEETKNCILTIINPTNYKREKSAFYILFLTGN